MSEGQQPGVSVVERTRSTPSRLTAVLWALLAALGHLLLIDAAVETFWSGSPLRWWISPLLILLAFLSIWLWWPGGRLRLLARFGPALAAATPMLGFVAVLAVTAWRAPGREAGVKALGLSTSTLLTLTVGLGVLGAGAVLLSAGAILSGRVRNVARIAIGLMVLYALSAFVLAVRDGLPFASLLDGGAFWLRLPTWLQGTFVGSMLLLPLGVAGQFLRVLRGVRAGRPAALLIHQAIALVLVLALAVSGVVVPTASGNAGSSVVARLTTKPPDVPPPTAEELAQTGRALFGPKDPVSLGEQFVAAAEQELSRPQADPSNVRARAEALGRDAERIFLFLRDQVALEPYVGVLRGSRGTLAALAGNALDRALLAQALLKESGVESRLVRGRVSDAQAETLLSRFLSGAGGPPLPDQQADEALDSAARQVAAKAGASPDALGAAVRRAARHSESFWWKVDERRAASREMLSGHLRNAGVTAPGNGQQVHAELRERLRDHYWLQTKDPSGTWTDFDPSFPGANPGARSGSDGVPVAAVPADRFHRFQIQLLYRTRAGGAAPHQEVLVKADVTAADALFVPVELRIQPAERMPAVRELAAMDGRQRAEMVRKLARFQVLLREGERVAAGRSFDLEGHVYDSHGRDPMGAGAGMMGGLVGFGGGEEPASFLDVQLVLRLTGPGLPPVTQTRTIAREADKTSRTFAPPVGEWQILVQPSWISPQLAGFQMLRNLTDLTAMMTESARKRSEPDRLPPAVPQQLLQLAVLRQTALARILSDHTGVKAFIDSPLLTVAGHRLSSVLAEEGRVVGQRTIDIVESVTRFVSIDPRSSAPFAAALDQGVADCTLEQQFLEDAFPGSTGVSAGSVFDRARLEGRQPQLAAARDVDGLRRAGLDEVDVEWITANEPQQARLLIATASPGPAAWWSIRPDGNAVLRVSGGRGQALTEHQMQVILKILGFVVCGLESYGAAHHYEAAASKVTLVWCVAATATSGVMVLLHAHTASWFLLGAEALVMVGVQAYETWGEH